MAVGLHQQQRFAVERQADLGEILDAADRHAVEELERAGDDFRGNDRRHGARGVFHPVVARQHGPPRGGAGEKFQEDLGDDAQRAFRADEEVLHRVAGDVLDAGVAEAGDEAVGQHDFEPHHVVAGHAVFQPAQAAGVLGDVAADRADAHRAGIGRIEQAVLARGGVDVGGDRAGLGAEC